MAALISILPGDLLSTHRVALVSGLNLPMLLRVLNHREENLVTLSHYAEEGGVIGISTISEAPEQGYW